MSKVCGERLFGEDEEGVGGVSDAVLMRLRRGSEMESSIIIKLIKTTIGTLLILSALIGCPLTAYATPQAFSGIRIVSMSMEFYVNGEYFVLHGYTSTTARDRELYRLRDIAYILNGTRAQFDIQGNRIIRGRPYTITGTELQPIPERRYAVFLPPRTSPSRQNGFPRDFSLGSEDHPYQIATLEIDWGWGKSISSEFKVLEDVDDIYFSIADLAPYLGFSIQRDWIGGRRRIEIINTYEPILCEYGQNAAADFLSKYTHYPILSYFFHDFNNNGIPEIFIHAAKTLDDNPLHSIYTYINGRYKQVGKVGPHNFYRDNQGDIFLFQIISDYEGNEHLNIQRLRISETELEIGSTILPRAALRRTEPLTSIRPFNMVSIGIYDTFSKDAPEDMLLTTTRVWPVITTVLILAVVIALKNYKYLKLFFF